MTRPKAPAPEVSLSLTQARRIAVASAGPTTTDTDTAAVLARLNAVQLDTISTLARAHQLTLAARTGTTTAHIDTTLWGTKDPIAFEYPAHALALVPLHHWPLWAFRRRTSRARSEYPTPSIRKSILDKISAQGPLTLRELRTDDEPTGWDWGPTKTAIEFLLWAGDIACTRRTGWQRQFDLPERSIPAQFLTDALSDDACVTTLLTQAGQALGVATCDDLADYLRITTTTARRLLPDTPLLATRVEGWSSSAWTHPHALPFAEQPHRPDHALFLAPFDNLIWHRPRTTRLFNFTHTLEAYKPAGRRVHGYYVCPLLAGDRLIARADFTRHHDTLAIVRTSFEPGPHPTETAQHFARACTRLQETTELHHTVIADSAAPPATVRALTYALNRTSKGNSHA
ncbi:crosslink repair DNA glycosylase YcaQ family protein [Streptomyces sp. RTGN2]|uniref:DNA glycosylase AlkZ-like family protein n=1 Tax=Streptomyces sp. RTGN2 TaxID=3016525 RepID=UPI0025543E4E|nr:crosslink repair DNA glycosylase YcaQ family protein [Streptomyces sp. RTGN2]